MDNKERDFSKEIVDDIIVPIVKEVILALAVEAIDIAKEEIVPAVVAKTKESIEKSKAKRAERKQMKAQKEQEKEADEEEKIIDFMEKKAMKQVSNA